MATREEYLEKVKAQLDNLNAELNTLEAKLSEKTGPARERAAAELAKVRQGYDKTKGKLDELREAGADSYDSVRGEVEHVWKAFKSSVNYFKSQI